MRTAALLLLPLLLAGCGQPAKPPVYRAGGKLIVGEQPAANANLAFHRIDNAGPGVPCPVAITRPDGSYQLTTHNANDGAPPGEYIVTIFWPDPEDPIDECACPYPMRHDLLAGLYAAPEKSPLRATIGRGRNDFTFDLAAVDRPATSPSRDRKKPMADVFSFSGWADADDE